LLDLTNTPEGFLDPVARVVEAALALVLSPTLTVRTPTVAGYAAAKLGAWPGELDMRGGPASPHDSQRRRNLLDALTRGLTRTPS